jgi:hypothetical protein
MRRTAALVAILVSLASARIASAKSPYDNLISTVKTDPSFKVRMQAIRVLVKQMKSLSMPADDEVLGAIGYAATTDEEKLVRGLACFALGEIKDARTKDVLARALKDRDPFVRAQAEEALKQIATVELPKKGGSGSTGALEAHADESEGPPVLVIGVDELPSVQVPREIAGVLRGFLDAEFQAQGAGKFVLNANGQGSGFKMNGSIAERSVAQSEGGGQRVTLVVRISIMTFPQNYLRHVVTAKASAEAHTSGSSLVNLEQKVLRAAVNRAVRDSLAEVAVD